MKIQFVDLKAQYLEIKEELDQAIKSVIGDSAFIGGKYVKSFEDNFARFVAAEHCVGVGNGTDALFIALKALNIKNGDEVITAANSFIATSEAITLAGATPVFVDCDPVSYNIDPDKIEEKITDRTRAVIPVHLYGQPAEMDKIMEIAKRRNLHVVEDAAQAHGALYKGRRIGAIGDLACFSFFPGKNLGAYGDAGAIITDSYELERKTRMFANHGRTGKYDHEFEGANSRLDGLQASILDVKLKYLGRWTERRREIARMYSNSLSDIVATPCEAPDTQHVYHLYVIRLKHRDEIRKFLDERGIATGIHYPIPLPFLKAYDYMGHKPQDFTVAYAIKDQILSLPIHGSMTDEQVAYVIAQFREAVKTFDGSLT